MLQHVTREDRPLDDQGLEEDEVDLSDPRHPDHDLSEWAPYTPPIDPKPWFIRRWALLIVGVLVIIGLILPFLTRL